MRTIVQTIVMVLLAFSLVAASEADKAGKKVLSKDDALALAVELANAECEESFGERPFDLKSFEVVKDGGRWRWGELDVHGENGYSARVSFNLKGAKDSVEVYLSTDRNARERRRLREKTE